MIAWIKRGVKFAEKCKKDHIGAFAAQSAFFLLLSLIPFLMVFSSLLQYTVVSEATLLKYVNSLAPEYIAPFIVSIIHEVYHKSVGIVSATAVAAIWSAAKGIQSIAEGFNCIYERDKELAGPPFLGSGLYACFYGINHSCACFAGIR